jgi:hypothetical protein
MKLTNTILHTVHDTLARDVKSRSNDMRLAVIVWATLHPNRIFTIEDHNDIPLQCFSMKDIAEIFESYETIRRSRQTIQNDLGLYPCTQKVKGRRKQSEEIMREWVNNNFTPAQTKRILTEYLNAKKK